MARRQVALVATTFMPAERPPSQTDIDERLEEIGRASKILLGSLLEHGDWDLPKTPRATMIAWEFMNRKTSARPGQHQ